MSDAPTLTRAWVTAPPRRVRSSRESFATVNSECAAAPRCCS